MGTLTVIDSSTGMTGYSCGPDDSRRSVVVVQEAFGVTTHIQDVCERLAALGYRAVAPSLFHRFGAPVFLYDDMTAVMPAMGKLTSDEIDADVDSAVAFLDTDSVGIIGFCMGGTVAFHTATRLRLAAAVSFYGGGVAEGRFGYPAQLAVVDELKTPWLGLYGDDDTSIPVADVEELRGGLSREASIKRYADAGHGFHCNDRPAMFNKVAAADAWATTVDWLAARLNSGD